MRDAYQLNFFLFDGRSVQDQNNILEKLVRLQPVLLQQLPERKNIFIAIVIHHKLQIYLLTFLTAKIEHIAFVYTQFS